MGHSTSRLQPRPEVPAAVVSGVAAAPVLLVVCGVPSSVPIADHKPLGVAAVAVGGDLLHGSPTCDCPWPAGSAAAVFDCCSAALLRQAMVLPRHCAQALRIRMDCFWLPMVFTIAERMDCKQGQ